MPSEDETVSLIGNPDCIIVKGLSPCGKNSLRRDSTAIDPEALDLSSVQRLRPKNHAQVPPDGDSEGMDCGKNSEEGVAVISPAREPPEP